MKLKMLTRMATMVAAGSLVVGLLAGCSVIPSKDGAADNAVAFIPLLQQELCQIGAVLTRDAGDQCFFHVFYSSLKK